MNIIYWNEINVSYKELTHIYANTTENAKKNQSGKKLQQGVGSKRTMHEPRGPLGESCGNLGWWQYLLPACDGACCMFNDLCKFSYFWKSVSLKIRLIIVKTGHKINKGIF